MTSGISRLDTTTVVTGGTPLDVNLVEADGMTVNVTAGDIGVQLSATGATPDSVRIGDGTNELAVNGDGSINAVVATGGALTVSTDSAVSVGTSDTAVLAANASRRYVQLVNDSTATIYLRLGAGAATLNSGIRVNPNGGSFVIDSSNLYTGEIRAIAAAAASNLTVVEAT